MNTFTLHNCTSISYNDHSITDRIHMESIKSLKDQWMLVYWLLKLLGCIHLLNTCKYCNNTHKYCGHTHEYWANTWKMCSPAKLLQNSQVLWQYGQVLHLQGNTFFKYLLNTREYYEYFHNTCKYLAGEYTHRPLYYLFAKTLSWWSMPFQFF